MQRTRLLVREVRNQRVLEAEVATGTHSGRVVLIPRVNVTPPGETFPFLWERRQFPVRVTCATTINKSQGQTLGGVEVFLEEPIFTHGQQYVASSRVSHPGNLRFAIPSALSGPAFESSRNVIYTEVLER